MQEFATSARVQASHWFIEKNNLWLECKHPGNGYTPLLATAQGIRIARAEVLVVQANCL